MSTCEVCRTNTNYGNGEHYCFPKKKMNKYLQPQTIKNKKGLVIEYKRVWLLYNFDNFVDLFWSKKSTWEYAERQSDSMHQAKALYQVYRGNVKINIYPKGKKVYEII